MGFKSLIKFSYSEDKVFSKYGRLFKKFLFVTSAGLLKSTYFFLNVVNFLNTPNFEFMNDLKSNPNLAPYRTWRM